jgi:hypothetical protein
LRARDHDGLLPGEFLRRRYAVKKFMSTRIKKRDRTEEIAPKRKGARRRPFS